MLTAAAPRLDSFQLPPFPVQRFSVDEYHRMIEGRYLDEDDSLELIEGWIVPKMPRSPRHDATIELIEEALRPHLPSGWRIRVQCAITTDDSEPEPDLTVVRGSARRRLERHPGPRDIGLVVEVAESSLDFDRTFKGPAYARAGIQMYWIVNLEDELVEVYSEPIGRGTSSRYRGRKKHGLGKSVSLVLDGREVARVPVHELLP